MRLSGEVVHAKTGAPIAEVIVDVSEVNGSEWFGLMPRFERRVSTKTDARGRFEFDLSAKRLVAVGPRCEKWPPSKQYTLSREEYEHLADRQIRLVFDPSICK